MNLLSKTSLVVATLFIFEASQPSTLEARDDDHHGRGHAEGHHYGDFHGHTGEWHRGGEWHGGGVGVDIIGEPVGPTNCWLDVRGFKHCDYY